MIRFADRLKSVEEYYFSTKLREVRGLIDEGKPIINMGIGSPDLSPPQEVLTSFQNSLFEEGAHQYQSYKGLPELRQTISAFYSDKFGVETDPETEVLPLMGSKEGIMHISMAFLNKDDEVLIPNPGYPTYGAVTKLVGAVPKYYELKESNKWFPDLEALASSDLSRVKIMWVSYPHMPTGATASRDQLQALIAFARKYNILIINDNPYSFVLRKDPMSLLGIPDSKEVVLELNSLSKTFNMAGWRVGMVLGKEAHIKAILKVKSNMDSGMFYGIQKGAVTALRSGAYWFDKLDSIYRRRQNLAFEMAEKLQCSFDEDSTGMFVWARLPNGAPDSESFINSLLYDKNIFIAPGTVFGTTIVSGVTASRCARRSSRTSSELS